MIGLIVGLMLLLLGGCTGGSVNSGSGDPYLHSEEAPFAAFCRANPHHGTCP